MHHPRGTRPFSQRPAVYPFGDRSRKDYFLQLVRDFLGASGQRVTIRDGTATVDGSPFVHGLQHLAQTCHLSPMAEWPTIVADHLARSDTAKVRAAVTGLFENGYAQSADSLSIRIYPHDFVDDETWPHFVNRRDLPQTRTTVVLDIGASVMPVPTPIAEQWGVPRGELFDRGLQNLARNCKTPWQTLYLPVDSGIAIDVLSDDFFAAAHVLRPDSNLPRLGHHGNLIGIPARNVLLSWPIDTAPTPLLLEALLAMTCGKHRDGPGSITPHLFWRTRSGDFLLQQGTNADGHSRLAPSPEFVDLLARLHRRRPRTS
ncbi:MAG: hypothetical protein KDC98_10300 [Planctomycetes bacterium]|nr:hypothetical protein [Planctomycetota bacterium]